MALTVAMLLVIVPVSVVVASALHDVSFDGQTYQQEGVLQLARGWNPVWDAPAAVRQLWPVDHYPKGAWLLGPSIYLVTGAIESAKAFTLVLVVASLVALNPVATTQWTGFFVDGRAHGEVAVP